MPGRKLRHCRIGAVDGSLRGVSAAGLASTPAVAASAVVASSLAVAVVSLAGAGQPPPLALAWLAVPACA